MCVSCFDDDDPRRNNDTLTHNPNIPEKVQPTPIPKGQIEMIADAKEEVPTLDEWMAKIRDKKLRKVVPNEHKAKELHLNEKKDRPTGPHEATEIVKLRQGLRSVSTPKWPGANDIKAKTNTTVLPQRAQLRSVSERTIPGPSAFSTESTKTESGNSEAEKSTLPNETASSITDDWVSVEKSGDSEAPVPISLSETSISDTNAIEADTVDSSEPQVQKDGSEEQSAVALDTQQATVKSVIDVGKTDSEPVTESKSGEDEQEPKSSTEAEDDFPLDLEKEKSPVLDGAEDVEEPSTPVTLSSGVFEPRENTIKLNLPDSDKDDFPLDLEQPQELADAEDALSEATAATSEVALSSAATEDSSCPIKLELPSKANSKAKEAQIEEVLDAQRTAMEQETEIQTAPVRASSGVLEPQSTDDITELLSEHASKDTTAGGEAVTLTEETRSVEESSVDLGMPSIKCSRCSDDLPLEDLESHDCGRASKQDF